LCAKVKFGRPEISKIVRYLPDKKNKNPARSLVLSLSLLRGSRPKYAWASGKQCNQSSPNFIQIGLLPTEL